MNKLLFGINKSRRLDIYILLIYIFLPLLFFSDGISKYLMVQGSGFYRISLIVRSVFEIVMIVYILKNIKKYSLSYLLAILFLFFSFLIGQVGIENLENLGENFISFNKYIYLFLVYLFFIKIIYLPINKQEKIFSLLQKLFLINILAVFMGMAFDLKFFESFYNMDYRYGYNGIFLAGNESSFVFISMLALLYFNAFYEKGSKLFFLLAGIASLFSGMKAIYIFLILLMVYHIIFKLKKIKLLLLIPLFLSLSGYMYNFFISNNFQKLITFFMHTWEEKGLWYMLLSGRNTILEHEGSIILEKWNLINYLFGGRDVTKYIMEMDFFDLMLFFGAIGTVVYIYFFYKAFIQKIFKYKFFKFFILSLLGLAFLGGHFLTSPTSAIYFTLVVIYFRIYMRMEYAKNTINQ